MTANGFLLGIHVIFRVMLLSTQQGLEELVDGVSDGQIPDMVFGVILIELRDQ